MYSLADGMGMSEGDIVSTYSVTMVVAGVAEQHVLHVPVLILGSGHNVISSFPIQPPGFYTDLAVHRAGVMGTPYGSYVSHAAICQQLSDTLVG